MIAWNYDGLFIGNITLSIYGISSRNVVRFSDGQGTEYIYGKSNGNISDISTM